MPAQYPERESKVLEFKSTLGKFDSVIKTSVAFATGAGGKIIVGIEDKTRNLIGVNDKLRAWLKPGLHFETPIS